MLTNVQIQKATPGEKPIRLFDGGGLYLEISPTGGKLWRFKYRFDAKEKRLALGKYPEISLANARKRREAARELIANGVDPSEDRKGKRAERAARLENNFEAVAREWFEKNAPNWAPTHADKIIKRLENDVFPWLGRRPIADITAPEVLKVLRRIEERGAIVREHVFPGRNPRKPMSDMAVNAALRRLGYDTRTEITGHGFRAMARTILHQELNFAPDLIEHQLAHRVPGALGAAYNRTKFIEQRRAMMQSWSDYLEKLKAGAEVVSIRRARAA